MGAKLKHVTPPPERPPPGAGTEYSHGNVVAPTKQNTQLKRVSRSSLETNLASISWVSVSHIPYWCAIGCGGTEGRASTVLRGWYGPRVVRISLIPL